MGARTPEPVPQPREIGVKPGLRRAVKRNCRSAPRSPATEPTPTTLPAPPLLDERRHGLQEPHRAGEAPSARCRRRARGRRRCRSAAASTRRRRRRSRCRRAHGRGRESARSSRARARRTASPRPPARRAAVRRRHSPRGLPMSRPASTTPSPFVTTARTKARAIDDVAPRMIQVSAMSEAPQVQTPGHVGFREARRDRPRRPPSPRLRARGTSPRRSRHPPARPSRGRSVRPHPRCRRQVRG